jgi:hypothetical protein
MDLAKLKYLQYKNKYLNLKIQAKNIILERLVTLNYPQLLDNYNRIESSQLSNKEEILELIQKQKEKLLFGQSNDKIVQNKKLVINKLKEIAKTIGNLDELSKKLDINSEIKRISNQNDIYIQYLSDLQNEYDRRTPVLTLRRRVLNGNEN